MTSFKKYCFCLSLHVSVIFGHLPVKMAEILEVSKTELFYAHHVDVFCAGYCIEYKYLLLLLLLFL